MSSDTANFSHCKLHDNRMKEGKDMVKNTLKHKLQYNQYQMVKPIKENLTETQQTNVPPNQRPNNREKKKENIYVLRALN